MSRTLSAQTNFSLYSYSYLLLAKTLGKDSPSYPTEKNGAAEYKWDKESRKIKQGQDTPKQQPLTTKLKPFIA